MTPPMPLPLLHGACERSYLADGFDNWASLESILTWVEVKTPPLQPSAGRYGAMIRSSILPASSNKQTVRGWRLRRSTYLLEDWIGSFLYWKELFLSETNAKDLSQTAAELTEGQCPDMAVDSVRTRGFGLSLNPAMDSNHLLGQTSSSSAQSSGDPS